MQQHTWILLIMCTHIAGNGLTQEINTHLRQLKKHSVGIKVVSLTDSSILYQKNDQLSLIPASTIKLVTAIAGLKFLGPKYQFVTQITTNGSIKNGTLHGNICLVGSGDPSLTTQDLRILVRSLKKRGIKHITGSIIVDASIFDNHYYAPGQAFINTEWRYAPAAILPTCGININHNYLPTTRRALRNPAHYAGTQLYACLRRAKIIIKKQILTRPAHYSTVLATHNSAPLSELIHTILKDSDNLYADCIFKAIAAYQSRTSAAWARASKIITDFLISEVRLDRHAFAIFEGSGISPKNKFTPHEFIQLLMWAYNDFEYFNELFSGLPQTGINGTVKDRLKHNSHGSKIHAKTGTKLGISSLVGYCIHDTKDPLVFAVMIQGASSGARKRALEDLIVKTILNHHHVNLEGAGAGGATYTGSPNS